MVFMVFAGKIQTLRTALKINVVSTEWACSIMRNVALWDWLFISIPDELFTAFATITDYSPHPPITWPGTNTGLICCRYSVNYHCNRYTSPMELAIHCYHVYKACHVCYGNIAYRPASIPKTFQLYFHSLVCAEYAEYVWGIT